MKTGIITAISLAGVLVAGSAAALVNTRVLGGSAAKSPLVVDAAPESRQPSPPSTAVVAPATSAAAAESVEAAPVVAAPAPAVTQAVYQIGESGTVTLDTAGTALTIVRVDPAAGWTVTKSETSDGTNAEVKFQSGTIEVDFHANLLFGVVTTSVDSNDLSTSDSAATNGGGQQPGTNNNDESHEGGGDDD